MILLPIGVGVLYAVVYGLSEFDADRKGVDPKASTTEQTVAPSDD